MCWLEKHFSPQWLILFKMNIKMPSGNTLYLRWSGVMGHVGATKKLVWCILKWHVAGTCRGIFCPCDMSHRVQLVELCGTARRDNISQINFFRYIKIQLHSEAQRTQTKEMNKHIQSVFFVYKSWILIYRKWSIGVAQLLKDQFSCQDMLLQHISGRSRNYFMFVHMFWFCACYMSPQCAPHRFFVAPARHCSRTLSVSPPLYIILHIAFETA